MKFICAGQYYFNLKRTNFFGIVPGKDVIFYFDERLFNSHKTMGGKSGIAIIKFEKDYETAEFIKEVCTEIEDELRCWIAGNDFFQTLKIFDLNKFAKKIYNKKRGL